VSGSVIVTGNISGTGISIGRGIGGGVWINGQRVEPNQTGKTTPNVQTEKVNLYVPEDGNQRSFNFETAAGNVSIEGVKNGKFEISIGTGSAKMERCSGLFNIKASSGDIKLTNTTCEGNENVITSSGDIALIG